MRRTLTDFKSLDDDIERQLEETQVIAELVKAVVKENATTAQSQETYIKKYEALTKRYDTAADELKRLQELKASQPKGQVDGSLHSHPQETTDSAARVERYYMDGDGREGNRPQER